MLHTHILAAGLFAASGCALAYDDYAYRPGRVVSVEPHFIIAYGNRHHEGYRSLYESDGHRYWNLSYSRPGTYYVLPPGHVRYIHTHRHHSWDDRRAWHDECHEHRRHGHDD